LGSASNPIKQVCKKRLLLKSNLGPKSKFSYLELVLVTSEGGALLLPEVVRLDDVGHVDERVAVLLQHLQDGFDRAPGGAPHVHHHGEPQLALLLAAKLTISTEEMRFSLRRRGGKGKIDLAPLCDSEFYSRRKLAPTLVSPSAIKCLSEWRIIAAAPSQK
jgi:hypothetical protein